MTLSDSLPTFGYHSDWGGALTAEHEWQSEMDYDPLTKPKKKMTKKIVTEGTQMSIFSSDGVKLDPAKPWSSEMCSWGNPECRHRRRGNKCTKRHWIELPDVNRPCPYFLRRVASAAEIEKIIKTAPVDDKIDRPSRRDV